MFFTLTPTVFDLHAARKRSGSSVLLSVDSLMQYAAHFINYWTLVGLQNPYLKEEH